MSDFGSAASGEFGQARDTLSAGLPSLRLRVFVASPGDVEDEREAARALMETVLPKDPLLSCNVTFDVVAWDHPAASTPMPAQLTPQEAVNRFKGRPSDCDIVLVILRARMGTLLDVSQLKKPDGSAYLSGTEWEFEDAWNATPRPEIMVYRCGDVPSVLMNDPHREEKLAQYDTLVAFLSRFENADRSWNGGINAFNDAADFRAKLETYLKHVIMGRLGGVAGGGVASAVSVSGSGSGGVSRLVLLPYPSLGPLFKGRDGFLRRLRDSLTRVDGGAAAIAGRAVHGLGGVGKTRAAVEYAWAYRDDYAAVALLDAETAETLQSSLAGLVGPLRLSVQAPEEAVRVEAVLGWLNANPGWLLIFDNIDSEAALGAAHHWLGRLSGGHVVFTSRLTRFPRGVERLDLDVLALDDAADFLLAATTGRRHADDDAARAWGLAEALGGLALALEMAAATIEALGLGFAGYQTLWEGNRKRVVGWAKAEITGYHHAVAETWRTSVDQLTEAGRRLLERLAFLAPEPVPVSLLDVAVPGAPDDEDLQAALDDLVTYSLATRDADGGTFLVHRLVLDVTRRGLAETGAEKTRLIEALGWLDAAFTGNPQDVRTWPVLTPLAPHAEAVSGYADTEGIAEPTVDLMGRLDMLFDAKSLHGRAEVYSRRALAIAEANFPTNDSRIATRLNNLAALLQATDRLDEAEPLMRRALAIDEASYGKDHPEVATDLNNLAQLLQATDRLDEAEPLMRRALAIDEASYGPNHPRVATRLNNLAALLQATNRLDEAEPLMRRALAIDEASYGKDHPNVAIRLNNLAALLQATNRLDEAEPLMRRALAIDEASYGKDHPRVAIRLNNLATLLQATNRLDEAEPLMRRALAIDEASYGKDHPRVAIRLNNLATLLQATNRLDEAEPLKRRALAIDEASYGKDHPRVATDLNNLATLLRDTNRLGEAEPLMRRALAIDEASYGKDHPDVAIDLNNLAGLLQATNRLDEAEPLMRRALVIDEASYGKDHPEVATDLNNLGRLLQATNRLDEAEPLMRRALAIFLGFQRDTGHVHPHRDAMIGNYAGLLGAMGKGEVEIDAMLAALRVEVGLGPA